MISELKRFLNELKLVSRILPPALFVKWLTGVPKCLDKLVKTKSLGDLDKNFGNSFDILWNSKTLHFERLDFGVVREIYGHLCYAAKGDLYTAQHILDLGANAGAFTVFALAEAPQARVHAVEAQPELLEAAKQNIQQNNYGDRATLECSVVGGFYDDWTNALQQKHPYLTTFDICKYIEKVGTCDFLKCDIEGGEFQLFQGDLSWTQSVKTMSLEFHPTEGNVDELETKIKSQGFQVRRVDHSCLGYFYCTRI